MPNINLTSSSFAQQDRFAQTTVSYESRHMQAMPFYPDVDHKAKFRGIMALTLVCTIVIGALLGLAYGYRDVIIDYFERVAAMYATAMNGEGNEEASLTEAPEDINFSLAAAPEDLWWYVTINNGNDSYAGVYNGMPHVLPGFGSELGSHISAVPTLKVKYTYQRLPDAQGSTTSYPVVTVDSESDWPTEAGTYVVTPYIEGYNRPFPYFGGTITLTIAKAPIPFPGIKDIADTVYQPGKKVEPEIEDKNLLPDQVKNNASFIIERYGQNGWEKVNKAEDAGKYRVTLTVLGNNNYETKTFSGNSVEFEIAKADFPTAEFEDSGAFVGTTLKYDGNQHSVKINEKKLSDFLKGIVNDKTVTYSYQGIDIELEGNALPINAGKYRATVIISHPNYKDGVFSVDLTITPIDITTLFTFKDASMVYNGKSPEEKLLRIAMNGNYAFPQDIVVNYIYTHLKDASGKNINNSNIGIPNIVDAGTYTATAEIKIFNSNYYLPEGADLTMTFEIKQAPITGVHVAPIRGTYKENGNILDDRQNDNKKDTDKDYITNLPSGVSISKNAKYLDKAKYLGAGVHEVEIALDGGNNYVSSSVKGKVIIAKAPFPYIDITSLTVQFIQKNGKLNLPVVEYDFGGNDYGEAGIEFRLNGKSIEGVDKLGTYTIDAVIYTENYEYIVPIEYTIKFNPLTIVMGIVVGIIAALIIAPIIWASYRGLEQVSYAHFEGLRRRLKRERGGGRGAIVCEGRVMIINWNSEQEHRDFPWIVMPRFGRLFLTHATLEYYDDDKEQNYRNFLVQLKEVTGVEVRGAFFRAKLIVFAKGARYVFYVEPNTAYLWRRDIIHFRDLVHLYPMENNVVDNNYPFNYDKIPGMD